MNLIFKDKNNEILNIDFNKIVVEDIIFGEDKVKEILITHVVKNPEDKTLDVIYKDINNIMNNNITEIIIYYNDNYQIKYNIPIEDIYYRIIDYSKKGEIKLLEQLSIRFIEDNKIIFNPVINMCFCDINKCNYLNFNYCMKYKKELYIYNDKEYIICKNCFLNMWPSLGNTIYNTMINFYLEKEDKNNAIYY